MSGRVEAKEISSMLLEVPIWLITKGRPLIAWTRGRFTTSEKLTKYVVAEVGSGASSVITMRPKRSVSTGQCLFISNTMRLGVALEIEYGPSVGRDSSAASEQSPWVPSAST